jgi:hypothetical protein
MSDVTLTRGGERERVPDGGGGLQRPRADGSNGRQGRPIVQRARNASFAIPKIRSMSFMQKEKAEDIPDANASPWGVEESAEDVEKAQSDAKALADKQLQARLARKVSLNVGAIGSPMSPSMSFSSPRRTQERARESDGAPPSSNANVAGQAAMAKGIRKSMSRFGVGVGVEGDAASQSVGDFASSTSPTSTVSAESDSSTATLSHSVVAAIAPAMAVTKTKSKVIFEDVTATSIPSKLPSKSDAQQVSKEVSRNATRESSKVEPGAGTAKSGGDIRRDGQVEAMGARSKSKVRGGRRDSDEKAKGRDKEKEKEKLTKGKSRKFGFSKLRSALHGHKKEQGADSGDDDGDDDDTDGLVEIATEVVVERDGGDGGGKGVVFAKEPSLRDDDFVNYQTRLKDGKSWGRKSRALK